MTPTAKSATLASTAAQGRAELHDGLAARIRPARGRSREARRGDRRTPRWARRAWSHLTLGQRARLLERLHATASANAEEWADIAALSKGLEPGHPLRGEEWLSGPYGVLVALEAYRSSILTPWRRGRARSTACGRMPPPAGACGRTRSRCTRWTACSCRASPARCGSRPGVTAEQARATAGLGQLRPDAGRGRRPRPRCRQRDVHPPAGRAVRAPGVQPGRPAQGQPDAGLPRAGVRAGVRSADRARLPADRAGRRRCRRVPDRPPRHRPRAHHGRGTRRSMRSSGARVQPRTASPSRRAAAAEEAHHGRAGRRLAHHRRAGTLDGRRSALPGRAHRDDAAAEQRAQLPRGSGRDPQLRLAAARGVPRRRCATPTTAPRRARSGTRAATRSSTPRHPLTLPRRVTETAAASSSRSHRAEDATALETTEYFAPVLGVVQLAGNGQEFLDASVAYANDAARRHTRRERPHRPRHPGRARRRVSSVRSRICATATISINSWTAFAFLTPTAHVGRLPGRDAR